MVHLFGQPYNENFLCELLTVNTKDRKYKVTYKGLGEKKEPINLYNVK